MRKRRSTLDDVAGLAGVSAITVSRALRMPDKVSPQLRKRIDQAVAKLAYVPNLAASRLASSRTHSVGVIVSSLSNGIFADYLRGLYDHLLPAGFQVVVLSSRYSPTEEENAIRTLLGQHIEAIIVAGIDQSPKGRSLLENSRVPVVQTFELADDPIDINVGLSQKEAGYRATRFLLEQGHRRVGYISGNLDSRARARLIGFERAMREFGLDPEGMSESLPPQSSVPLGRELLANLVGRHPDLEAVFCCDDNLSLGALFECQRRNIAVPGQISLMGFNDLEFAACATPSLSTISTPRYEMGKRAAEIVVAVLGGEPRPEDRRIDVGFSVTGRESTAPRRMQTPAQ